MHSSDGGILSFASVPFTPLASRSPTLTTVDLSFLKEKSDSSERLLKFDLALVISSDWLSSFSMAEAFRILSFPSSLQTVSVPTCL